MSFISFDKYFHKTPDVIDEFQRKYRKIIREGIRYKRCWTCAHTKTLKDFELSCETSITLCEFTKKPIWNETCEHWEPRKDLLLEVGE